MFERFTPSSRAVVQIARLHAERLGHRTVGTEHVLLALTTSAQPVRDVLAEHGVTAEAVTAGIATCRGSTHERDRAALASLGIDLDRVLDAVVGEFGPGALDDRGSGRRRRRCTRPSIVWDHLGFSPRAKKTLELALREALRLKSNAIGPEHLLLGILREGQGLACVVLDRHQVSFVALRSTLEARVRRRSA